MHPVIRNLLARKNKSGSVNDGRKIALVLYGGIMLGVRGAGGLCALEQAGLSHAFDEIYTMSSGFLNASYFLSGQITEGLAAYCTDFAGHRFLNPWRFWKIADIDYLISVVRKRRPLRTEMVFKNKVKLFAMLINAQRKSPEYLEGHGFDSEGYFGLIRAASSLPFIGHGNTILRGFPYHDILRDNNLSELMRHVIETDATDIMVLYNYPWQKKYVDKKVCIVKENGRIAEICLEHVPMSRFETNADKLLRAGEDAKEIMNHLLEA